MPISRFANRFSNRRRRRQRQVVRRRSLLPALIAAIAVAPPVYASIGSGYVDWYWGNPSPQGTLLGAVDFAGGRGHAGGEETLLRTDDGGRTWTGLNSQVLNPIDRLQVIDPDTVVALGNCVLRRSDDG